MLHARADYNRIQDPAKAIPDEEPVFLLRAQDKTAAATVRHWASLQVNEDIAEMAMEHANLMDEWPTKKAADLMSEEDLAEQAAKEAFQALDQAGVVNFLASLKTEGRARILELIESREKDLIDQAFERWMDEIHRLTGGEEGLDDSVDWRGMFEEGMKPKKALELSRA